MMYQKPHLYDGKLSLIIVTESIRELFHKTYHHLGNIRSVLTLPYSASLVELKESSVRIYVPKVSDWKGEKLDSDVDDTPGGKVNGKTKQSGTVMFKWSVFGTDIKVI